MTYKILPPRSWLRT